MASIDLTVKESAARRAGSVSYRPDIDGLRAVAVLSVLFYHAGLPPFSGGFVGVDIFFVISGYLITGILYNDLQRGEFSIARFYERRVRRIFPALYATTALTLAIAAVLFSAVDLERLHTSVAWLAAFASNVYFMNNAGYFDAASEQNAILQTWSLAIEEQFYVVFPLALALFYRLDRARLKWIVLAIAILSLAFSIATVDRDARTAFFSTPGRVWELMMGALLALGLLPTIQGSRQRNLVAGAGALLAGGSLVLLTNETPFPGAYAVPACLGAALMIWANGSGATIVGGALSTRAMVFVGLISYSLYLLHWPLLTFARYYNQAELSPAQIALVLALAFAGAWVSWRYIETPLRRPYRPMSRRTLFGLTVSLMLALGVGSYASAQWQAGKYTAAEKLIAAEEARARKERCLIADLQTFADWKGRNCTLGGTGDRVAVWGDSFAAHYFGAFRALAERNGRPITLLARGSCPPIVGLSVPNRPGCEEFNGQAIALLLEQRPTVVVISADWMIYEKKKTLAEVTVDKFALLEQTIDKLRANGSRILILGPSPMFPVPVAQIAHADKRPAATKASYSRRFDGFFRTLEARGVVQYFPTYEAFCDTAVYCQYRDGEALLFWDTGHLTAQGGMWVVQRLIKKFPTVLKREDGGSGP